MLTIDRRVCNQVLNLLAPPADGDIIVPQRNTSILGTTSWAVTDPDDIPIPPDHLELLFSVAERMVPAIRTISRARRHGSRSPVAEDIGRQWPQRHAWLCLFRTARGAPGFFSVVGGKTSTARLMAEKIGDQVTAYLGWEAPCDTSHDTPTLPSKMDSPTLITVRVRIRRKQGWQDFHGYPAGLRRTYWIFSKR